ncbi:MAG TPA: sigma-70 family RNA polymerase sigma factor [Pyrinomonadaceae bacterium]|nr:sigma-70 family RNA polymerase sigma factor [Pyrinomonadaceae bacterium]
MDDRQVIESFLLNRAENDFSFLFESFYPRLRRYFLLRGLEWEEAEDLAQNVMVIVFRRGGEVREKELFIGWLFKVAKNELARHWRRRLERNRLAEFEPLSEELAKRLMIEMELISLSPLTEWLSHLEPAERELILLRFVEELSYEELAVVLEVPLGTVKWRLFQAKRKLAPIIKASLPNRRERQID